MPFESYSTTQSFTEGKTFEERKRVYIELRRRRQAKNKPPPPPRPPTVPDPSLPVWPYCVLAPFVVAFILLLLWELARLILND